MNRPTTSVPVPRLAETPAADDAAGASALHRIVHVVDSLEFGGLERVVTDLAIEQAAHGHRVAVFSLLDCQGFRAELDAAGIPVVIGDKRRGLDTALLRRLRRTVAEADADIVHSHNFVPNYYAAAALAWPTGRRRTLVNTCHNMGSRLANTRLRWLYRLSLARTARVAMVGRQVHAHFLDAGIVRADRAEVVLNGIPTGRHEATADARAEARAALGLAADALVIGSVGRLVALKNHRMLLAQLPALAAAYPSLHMVLIGDGPLRAELEDQAASLGVAGRVRFTGARTDVAALLPALDVFVLPSLTEGLSIALLEACAARLAIVATAVGGNPEIVTDSDTGLLVPAGDGEALHAALDGLLAEPATRTRLGAAAREWVCANASIQAMRRHHDSFYAAALGAPTRPG